MKVYTYDAWVEKFKPIKNSFRKYDEIAFETYGDEVEFVQRTDNRHVWTEVDGDSGTYIITGYHFVNRIQYYVTEQPWDDENIEVPTWGYSDCDCMREVVDGILSYKDDPNPDCELCEGEGSIDVTVATVDDLRKIYGDGLEIIGVEER